EATLREVPEAARALGLQIRVLNASTSREIEAAFASLGRAPADALYVPGEGFFISRRVQFTTLATRYGIPAIYSGREFPEVGGLMCRVSNWSSVCRGRPTSEMGRVSRASPVQTVARNYT